MKILVACEYSGVVRDAFRAKGHDAWSCDLLPCEGDPTYHRQENILDGILDEGWDLMIAHPPCTDLAVSGAAWFKEKIADGRQMRALRFVRFLLDAPIPRIALENPVSVISTKIRKPDQIIQPYHYGHNESKKTCLWLKNLPKLIPTNIVEPVWVIRGGKRYSPLQARTGKGSGHLRSKTFQGIADAMAEQWG